MGACFITSSAKQMQSDTHAATGGRSPGRQQFISVKYVYLLRMLRCRKQYEKVDTPEGELIVQLCNEITDLIAILDICSAEIEKLTTVNKNLDVWKMVQHPVAN